MANRQAYEGASMGHNLRGRIWPVTQTTRRRGLLSPEVLWVEHRGAPETRV